MNDILRIPMRLPVPFHGAGRFGPLLLLSGVLAVDTAAIIGEDDVQAQALLATAGQRTPD